MFFFALTAPAAASLDALVRSNVGLAAYTSEIYKQCVIIASATRAQQVIGVDRIAYCKSLRSRLTLGLNAVLADTVVTIVDLIIGELISSLNEVATKKECLPMMYRLYRKDGTSFFVTKMR